MKKRILSLVALVLILTMLITACNTGTPSSESSDSSESTSSSESSESESSEESEEEPQEADVDLAALGMGDENVLVIPSTEGNGIFNGLYYTAAYDADIVNLIFESLIEVDEKGNAVFNDILVESLETSEDGLTYTFKLKENITFSDGTPLTANDVVFSMKVSMDPGTTARNKTVPTDFKGGVEYQEAVKAGNLEAEFPVVAVDDYTVQFSFTENKRTNINRCSFSIMSEAYYPDPVWGDIDKTMDPKLSEPMGSGAYVLDVFKPAEYVTLTKNATYHAAAETDYKIEKIIIRYLINMSIAIDELIAGNGHYMAGSINLDEIDKAKAAPDVISTHEYMRSAYGFVGFNTTEKSPLQYKGLRQAIGYTLDREEFDEAQFGDYGKPIDIPMSQASSIYQTLVDGGELNHYVVDNEKAMAALEADGFKLEGETLMDPSGEPVVLNFHASSGNSVVEALIPVMEYNLKEIGITLETDYIEFNALLEILGKTDEGWDMYFMASSWTSADPDSWRSFTPDFTPANNYSRFTDERITKAITEGRKILDLTSPEAFETYSEVALILNEELPYLPLYANTYCDLYRSEVKNMKTSTFIPWTKALGLGTTVEAVK